MNCVKAKKLARQLVRHALNMGADRAEIPIEFYTRNIFGRIVLKYKVTVERDDGPRAAPFTKQDEDL